MPRALITSPLSILSLGPTGNPDFQKIIADPNRASRHVRTALAQLPGTEILRPICDELARTDKSGLALQENLSILSYLERFLLKLRADDPTVAQGVANGLRSLRPEDLNESLIPSTQDGLSDSQQKMLSAGLEGVFNEGKREEITEILKMDLGSELGYAVKEELKAVSGKKS